LVTMIGLLSETSRAAEISERVSPIELIWITMARVPRSRERPLRHRAVTSAFSLGRFGDFPLMWIVPGWRQLARYPLSTQLWQAPHITSYVLRHNPLPRT
jgi:hypothetical protein